MITLELDKEDLITLVCGSSPSYKQMEHPTISKFGRYSGSYDRWDWNSSVRTLNEQDLLALYLFLKGRI